MKVQQTIKKVGAVAASTLMVGMTMGAAQSLSDFPGMFTDDDGTPTAEIVVGSEGQVADVVGAVNVAAALGQETVQTEEMEETVEGQTTESVNGGDYETVIRQAINEGSVTSTDYDGFERNYEYDSDDELSVTESASFDNSGLSVGTATEVDHEGELRVNVASDDDLQYTAQYRPGVEEEQSLYILGEQYEVTTLDGETELELGSQMENRDLDVGDTVEHGPFTLEITDVDTEDSEIRVQVTKDGEIQDTITMATDGNSADSSTGPYTAYHFGDDDEFTVDVRDIWFGDQSNQIDIDTTYSEYTQESDSEFVFDEDYDMTWSTTTSGGTERITDITLTYNQDTVVLGEDQDTSDLDDDEVEALRPDESIAGPMDAFSFIHQGLTDSATEDVDFSEEFEVEFTDAHGQDHTLALADDLHNGQNVDSSSSGDFIVEADDGNVPAHFDVQDVDIANYDSPGSDDTLNVDFEYGAYEEEIEFDLSNSDATVTIDSAPTTAETAEVYEATDSGYGFTMVAAVHDSASTNNAPSSEVQIGYTTDGTNYHFYGPTWSNTGSNVESAVTTMNTDYGATLAAGDDSGSETGNLYELSSDATDAGQYLSLTENAQDVDHTDVQSEMWVGYDHGDSTDGTAFGDADTSAGQITEVVFDDQGNGNAYSGSLTDWEDGEMTLTNYGSHVDLGSETSVTVDHPEEVREVDTALGSVTEEAGDDQTVTYEGVTNPDIRGTLDDMSMLDSEVTQSVRDSSDLILVGGPAVNTLVQDLANDGDTWTADNWRNNHQDEALVQLVEDAFTDGQHALIVAGYQAQDTRAAANYISNYAEHADELEGETQVTMTRGEYPGQ